MHIEALLGGLSGHCLVQGKAPVYLFFFVNFHNGAKAAEGCKEGRQGREADSVPKVHQEAPQCAFLQAKDPQASSSTKVPEKVCCRHCQDGQVCCHQVPSDYRVCHEEDRGDQHLGFHCRHQGVQAEDQGGCQAAV